MRTKPEMDYKEQQWMNQFSSLSKQCFPRLSSTPAKTLIDPGLARIAPLHHLYVPLTAKKSSPYEISKKIDLGTNETANDFMDGTGLIKPEVQTPSSSSDEPNKLSDGVLFSFLHPKIETDKIVFENKPKTLKRVTKAPENDTTVTKKTKVEKKMTHKFQFLE